jgi:hypothetical protein
MIRRTRKFDNHLESEMDEYEDGWTDTSHRYLKDVHYHAHWPYLFADQKGMSFNPFHFTRMLKGFGLFIVSAIPIAIVLGVLDILFGIPS